MNADVKIGFDRSVFSAVENRGDVEISRVFFSVQTRAEAISEFHADVSRRDVFTFDEMAVAHRFSYPKSYDVEKLTSAIKDYMAMYVREYFIGSIPVMSLGGPAFSSQLPQGPFPIEVKANMFFVISPGERASWDFVRSARVY